MKKRARKAKTSRKHGQAKKTLKLLGEEVGVRRALWILKVPTSRREVKGLVTEEKALRSFEYFQRKKEEFFRTGIITKVTPTLHYSEEDGKGIDFKVEFQSGKTLLVDVKSWGSQKLEEKLRERNRCLIVIPWTTPEERARNIVKEAVNQFFCQKQESGQEKGRSSAGQTLGAYH